MWLLGIWEICFDVEGWGSGSCSGLSFLLLLRVFLSSSGNGFEEICFDVEGCGSGSCSGLSFLLLLRVFLSGSANRFEEFLFISKSMISKSSAFAGLFVRVFLSFFRSLATLGLFTSVSCCTIGETDFCVIFSIVCGSLLLSGRYVTD